MAIRGFYRGLLAILALALVALDCRGEPDWKPAVKWGPAETEQMEKDNALAIKKRVQEMVVAAADPNQAQWADEKWTGVPLTEAYALKALAVMAALPYLREGQPAAVDKPLFDSAKALAHKAMDRVLETALPEFWSEQGGRRWEGDTEAAMDVFSGKQKKNPAAPALYPSRVYGVTVMLMALEYYFSGALEITYENNNRRDRPAQGQFLPPTFRARLGVARLAALLLDSGPPVKEGGPNHVFDAKPEAGVLWEYAAFGQAGQGTCLHKSGFALMGLRGAFSLGLASYDEDVFRFKWNSTDKDPLGRARFFDRLSDVLVHSLLTVLRIPSDGGPASAIGVVGFSNFARLRPDLKDLAAVKEERRRLDVVRYRTLYAVGPDGRRSLAVEYDAATPVGPEPLEAFYRYKGDGDFGTYYTLSAMYVLVTCANCLPMVLEGKKDPKGCGEYYKIERTGEHAWNLTDKVGGPGGKPAAGRQIQLTWDPEAGQYTHLGLAADGEDLDVNRRIRQCLNFVIRLASKPVSENDWGERKLDRDKVSLAGAPMESWEATLTGPGHHVYYLRGLDLFGFVKIGLALGEPYTLGPWPYYRSICAAACDDAYVKQCGSPTQYMYHREFTILILSQGYRPLFGRDGGTSSDGK